jgi:hypothetical protein
MGWPTATTGLIAIATDVAHISEPETWQPIYDLCAGICQTMSDCKGYPIDRYDPLSFRYNCNFYDINIPMFLQSMPPGPGTRYVWMDKTCQTATGAATTTPSITGYPAATTKNAPPSSDAPSTTSATATATVSPTITEISPSTTPSSNPVSGVSTYAAASGNPCNVVGAFPWPTCRRTGYATPTTGLLTVATGIPGSVTTDFGVVEPQVQRCARMRQGLTGCASFQIDRTDVDNWKCLFWKDGAYRILVYPNGTSKANPAFGAFVLYDARCHWCQYLEPWPPALPGDTPSTSSTPPEPSDVLPPLIPDPTLAPSDYPLPQSEVASSPTPTSATPTPSPTATPGPCTKVLKPDDSLGCDIRGFNMPVSRPFDSRVGIASLASAPPAARRSRRASARASCTSHRRARAELGGRSRHGTS